MKIYSILAAVLIATVLSAIAVKPSSSSAAGHYLEVRSCDVYTGPCFANAEVGLAGKEGILVWSIERGEHNGTDLSGLTVIAVVRTQETLGDVRYEPRRGQAVLITDNRATRKQRQALIAFAQEKAGALSSTVTDVLSAPIHSSLGTCAKSGCASVTAGTLVEISTRCFAEKDHVCGNEETYYPPLTELNTATAAFTQIAAFRGSQLNLTWESTGQRSAFIGTFGE